MPRNYIRKTDRGLKYTREQLLEAVEKVRSGEYNGYEAATRYNIPRTTLNDRVTGKHGRKSQSMGKPPVFSTNVEKTLADNLKALQENGFTLTKKDILELVGFYAITNKIKTPFKSGIPGESWLCSFAKRHGLNTKPLYAEFGCKDKDVIIVKEFYSFVESKINELGLEDKPGYIWHIEEHSFSNGNKVPNNDKQKDFTVVTACSAEGGKAPLLIVFKGEESREWMLGKHVNVSHNLGICRDVFKSYFTTIFLNYIDDSQPNLVIYDGQSTHMDIGLIDDARKSKVTIIKSSNLEALGLSITSNLKLKWSKENETHIGSPKEFANVVADVFDNAEVFEIKEGFNNAGVYPFATVCDSKFDRDRLKVYEEYTVFKASQLRSKATSDPDVPEEVMIKIDGKEHQMTLMMELEQSAVLNATEMEAIFVPGEMELPQMFSSRNPKSTKIAVRKGLTINKDSGVNIVLTNAEEDQLVSWAMDLNNAGFSITEDHVSDAVYNLVTNSERAPLDNKMPNRRWYEDFLKRHAELADRISEDLPTLGTTDDSVKAWFDRLQAYLKRRDLEDVVDVPRRIFNCREAALYLDSKDQTSDKIETSDEDLTVYVTASADGKMQPLSVIFPFKTASVSSNGFGRSVSSWMKAEFFNDQITDIFYPWLIERNIPLPVMLFMDHTTRIDLTLSEFFKEKRIIPIALPNHIQPLESVFHQLKEFWNEKLTAMQILRKEEIAKELEICLSTDFGMEIRNGFNTCGLYPFNPI